MAGKGNRSTGPGAAAIYARISDDRVGKALGVKRQEQDGRALAKERHWPIAGVYIDSDRSAYNGKPRPEYERLLTDIASGAIDGVIAYQLDRLYRRPVELEHFITLADAHGVHLATVAGGIDLSTAQGRIAARGLGNAAAYESEIKSERIQRMHEQLAAAGKLSGGGSRPFGYEQDRVTIRAAEAALIRTAARRVIAGDSMNSIVNDWNATGIRTSYGKVWDVSGLRQVLTSARISGRREHHGEVVATATWKGIVSAEDSDRLRRALGPARGRRPGPPTRFLLTGLLRCGRCAVGLAGSRAPTHVAERATATSRYATRCYACARHPRNRPTACGRLRVRANPLEAHITEMAFAVADSPKLASRIAGKRNAGERESAFDVVAQIESDLRELARDFGEGNVQRAEWVAARGPLERRLGAAQQRLSTEQGTSALNGLGKPGQLRKAWDSLSLDRRRAILAILFDRITIAPANPKVARNVFDPSRVEVVWKV